MNNTTNPAEHPWPLTRVAVIIRDGARCVYCGAKGKGVRLAADHVTARSRGGSDDPTNLVTACKACNTDKAHMSVAIYVLHRAEQGLPTAGLTDRVAAAVARPVDWTAAALALASIRRNARR